MSLRIQKKKRLFSRSKNFLQSRGFCIRNLSNRRKAWYITYLEVYNKIRLYTMGRDYNGRWAFDLCGKANFSRISWFPRNQTDLYSLGFSVMWLCCYITWTLELPHMAWLSHRLAYCSFQCIISYQHKKPKQTCKLSNFIMEPVLRLLTSQNIITLFVIC